jgi:hypothetical protein
MAAAQRHRAQFELRGPVTQQTAEHALLGFDVEGSAFRRLCRAKRQAQTDAYEPNS